MSKFSKKWFGIIFLVLSVGFLPLAISSPSWGFNKNYDSREYKIKAAFIYNFTKFINWPQGIFLNVDAPLNLCLLGDDSFRPILEETVKGKIIHSRQFSIQSKKETDNFLSCHLLYIYSLSDESTFEVLDSLQQQPVVTVFETASSKNQLGIIRLIKKKNKIHFEINQTAAQKSGLKISSQLLKLGRKYSSSN